MLASFLLAIVPLLTLVKADIDHTKAYIKPKAYPSKCVVAPNGQTDSPIVLLDQTPRRPERAVEMGRQLLPRRRIGPAEWQCSEALGMR